MTNQEHALGGLAMARFEPSHQARQARLYVRVAFTAISRKIPGLAQGAMHELRIRFADLGLVQALERACADLGQVLVDDRQWPDPRCGDDAGRLEGALQGRGVDSVEREAAGSDE